MAGRFLLDTSVVIPMLAGDAPVRLGLTGAAEVFLPAIALGELFYGAMRSSRATMNMARISELARSIEVVPCDEGTALVYGQVRDRLRAHGSPLPENDIWIGALAVQHDLTLVTRDDHFKAIERLAIDAWL